LAFCDRPAGTVAKVGTKSKKGRKLGNGEFTAEHARCGNGYDCGFLVSWY